MSQLLSNIESQIGILPKKDIEYAKKFIEKRDFESLYELVEADHKIHYKKSDNGFFENDEDEQLDQAYTRLEGDVLTYLNYIDPDYKKDLEDEGYCEDYYEDNYTW